MKRKKLSLHVNREVEATSTVRAVVSKRGVYEEEIAPEGEHWYKIGTVHFPDELCDEGTAERLWAQLDEKDPTTDHSHLQLVGRK
jgi:hypothetical protein